MYKKIRMYVKGAVKATLCASFFFFFLILCDSFFTLEAGADSLWRCPKRMGKSLSRRLIRAETLIDTRRGATVRLEAKRRGPGPR